MTAPGQPSLATLLEHEGFLRRLAAALVPAHEIDDLVQDTWAAAVAAPSDPDQPKAWLSGVMRRLAARRHRRVARRVSREQRAARPEDSVPSSEAMLERLEAHRLLAEAVAALDEPYREAVLLRYFEDLPPSEIARRLGLPASTVRTRLERGVARLRGRLQGRQDLRSLVALVLLPRAGERFAAAAAGTSTAAVPTGTAAIGGLLMTSWYSKIGVGAAIALLCLGLALWLVPLWGGAPDDGRDPATVTATVSGGQEMGSAEASKVVADRVAVDDGDETQAPATNGDRVTVRVLDARGFPVAAVPLLREGSPTGIWTIRDGRGLLPKDGLTEFGVSGDDGAVAAVVDGGRGLRLWAGEGFVTLATAPPDGDGEGGFVVVARAQQIEGEVVDEFGANLEGVGVSANGPDLVDFPLPLDRAFRAALPTTRTNESGRFQLDVPVLQGAALQFDKPGYIGHRESCRASDVSFRHVVLRKVQTSYRVTGKVVGPGGGGIWGATVVVGGERVTTGFLGGFTAEMSTLPEDGVFLAAKRGARPVFRPELLSDLRRDGVLEGVVMTLDAEPLSQSGVVENSDGKPVPDLVVTIWRPIQIDMFTTPEDLARGREGQSEFVGKSTVKVDARTDADGRFTVEGLGNGPYRYRVFDPATLASVTTGPVVAGSLPLRIVLDVASRRTVRGVVQDRQGRGIAGIRVAGQLTTFQTDRFSLHAPGPSTTTDETGAFVLGQLPVGDLAVAIRGTKIMGRRVDLGGFVGDEPLAIEVYRRCRFRVERPGETADRVEMRDAEGQVLSVYRTRGGIVHSGEGWAVADGRTPILEVSEAATLAVFLREGREVSHFALRLDPDAITVVR